MTRVIPGIETLLIVVILFGIIGFLRGWRKMGVVFAGTLLTAVVLLEDQARLIKIVNSMPKVIDLMLDTKLAANPPITDANKPMFLLGVLILGVVLSWLFSNLLVAAKGTKMDLGKPVQSLIELIGSLSMGAGTGYLILIKSYEYLLAFPADLQHKLFQTITIILLPIPSTNVLKQYEALLYLAVLVLVVLSLLYTRIFGKGFAKGKTEGKAEGKAEGGDRRKS